MVSPLDLGLFKHFEVLFPFLFVLFLSYGVLSFLPMFKDKKAVQMIIAVALAFMTLFSDIAINTINVAAPWFVLLFFFIVFILMAVMLFGAKDTDVMSYIKGSGGYAMKTVVVLGIVIALGSLMQVIAERGGVGEPTQVTPGEVTVGEDGSTVSADQAPQEKQFWQTISHPKVLGMVLILIISLFAVLKLSSESR
jgi:hypothetical protein